MSRQLNIPTTLLKGKRSPYSMVKWAVDCILKKAVQYGLPLKFYGKTTALVTSLGLVYYTDH